MAAAYVIIFISGLIAGSFVNVLIYRIPMKKSVILQPSACTSCGSRLTAPDLVPVFSYIYLKGKCRHCGAGISPRYPLTELLTAVIFSALFFRYGFSMAFFAYAFLMTVLIAVFFIDIDHRIIPNGLVITGMAGGLIFAVYNMFMPLADVFGDDKWWTPFAGLIPGTGFLLLTALLGALIYKTDDAMGMGDVKLMAPIGLFLGWKLCTAALFISVAMGGIISLILMLTGIKKRKDTVAFGPFIVVGAFITVMWGWNLINWYFTR